MVYVIDMVFFVGMIFVIFVTGRLHEPFDIQALDMMTGGKFPPITILAERFSNSLPPNYGE